MRILLGILILFAVAALPLRSGEGKTVLKAGIIGLDTSHVPAFTGLLNKPKEPDFEGVRVVAAFAGGSPDIPSSKDRLEGFTREVREKFDVEIVDSIDELLKKVDVVLLESVDGRKHLEQATPVIKAGKKLFIDKPIAGSLADCLMIFELARAHKVPVFSSSSLRFASGVAAVKTNPKVGKVFGCDAWSPCPLEEHHPDFFWYGVHGVETLFTIMGTGCEKVTRTHSKEFDVVTGTWKDGRIGTFRGIRSGKQDYGAMVFGKDGIAPTGGYTGYEPLVKEIVKFFKTGVPPVSAEETTEMFAFMEAADESKRQGGRPVTLASVLEKARAANLKRLK
ncbi:MAG: Gfo/Idh/MocA family oxidoreductase [Planctomycetes bacterium]|nr:Gfo/Idh/MocA family oxidoreductase [Planctomycetota bacterium]